ncbi:unnamed protein product [Cunninghamella blakesleeana]
MEDHSIDTKQDVKSLVEITNTTAFITLRDLSRDYNIPRSTLWSKLKNIQVNYNGHLTSAQELSYLLFHQQLKRIKINVHKCEDHWVSRYKLRVVWNSRFGKKSSTKIQTKETERITELDLNGEEFNEINEYIRINEIINEYDSSNEESSDTDHNDELVSPSPTLPKTLSKKRPLRSGKKIVLSVQKDNATKKKKQRIKKINVIM